MLGLVDGLWLGDHAEAGVTFPGTAVQLTRRGAGWSLGGLALAPGVPVELRCGPVVLRAGLVVCGGRLDALRFLPDPVPFVLTAALVLLAATAESARRVVDEPEVAAQVQALLFGASSPEEASAPVGVEGPRWRPPVSLAPAP